MQYDNTAWRRHDDFLAETPIIVAWRRDETTGKPKIMGLFANEPHYRPIRLSTNQGVDTKAYQTLLERLSRQAG